MKQYDFYKEVSLCSAMSEDARAMAQAYVKKEDAKREAKAAERAAIVSIVIDYIEGLDEGTMFCAKDIAEAKDMTSQKASSILKSMVEDGSIVKVEGSAAPVQYTKA